MAKIPSFTKDNPRHQYCLAPKRLGYLHTFDWLEGKDRHMYVALVSENEVLPEDELVKVQEAIYGNNNTTS